MPRLRAMLRPVKIHPIWGAVIFSCLVLIVVWAFVPQVAQAAWTLEGVLIALIGHIVSAFVSILGTILIKFIGILVAVAQFNNFIDAPAVRIGWSVTRDMANMFFIVALLLIAIGTMFKIDQYRYSRTLFKLIMMAILINFSKAIAGFFIDFSQVVMLTFVNAFKDQAAGSLSAGFGIDNLLQISDSASAAGGDINSFSVLGSLFAALIMVFVATVVVAIFTILLIQRIIMLWIYIVLAPTAYMVAVLPGGLGSWWGKWWSDFSQYLIKGPVIAFFLWLALTVITLSTDTLIPTSSTLDPDFKKDTFDTTLDKPAFVNKATTGPEIINYIVAVGMLIAGLQQAAKSSGAAGAVAGKWMGNFNKWGSSIAQSPVSFGKYALKRPAYGTAGAVLSGASKIPLVGGTFGKLNARLTRHRQKQEDKDSDWINYADDATKKRYATSNFALTESGRINNKIARENMIKNNQFRGLKKGQKDEIIENYRSDIGQNMKREYNPKTKKYDGKYYESATDSPGLKVLTDYLNKKSPASMEGALKNATDPDLKTYWKERIKKSIDKMSPSDFNEMDASDWDVTKHKVFTELALPRVEIRTGKPDFLKKMNSELNLETYENINKAAAVTHGVKSPLLYQEDIDRDRQARTAARVAAYQQRKLNFHESDEYLKNQGQFYDQQSYGTNLAQEARRSKREEDKARGAFMPATGASTFASGADNTLAFGEDVLKRSGVRLTAAGTVIDPGDKQKLADEISKDLDADISTVEANIARIPADILDIVQTGSGTGTTTRQGLERQLEVLKGTRNRLQDSDQLGSLKFINADRYGGNVRNAKAEEDFHEKLEEMDADGSFREQLRQSMSPEQMQHILTEQRAIPGQENIDEERAFEEHLAKGLTNLTRGSWADTGPNAVKLSSGLALQVQRQAEAKNVNIHKLGLLQDEQNVSALEAKLAQERQPKTAKAEPKVKPLVSQVPSQPKPETAEKVTPQISESSLEAAPNITNNITQNIHQAFKVAPADVRAKLESINGETLDSALKNSIVWRGLMSYIRNNTAEVQKSEKLGDLGREELQKRIGKLQGHMDEGNAEAFKNEFGELQSMFSGGSSSSDSPPSSSESA